MIRLPDAPVVRPFWSGTISFGLIGIPVHLYPGQRNVRPSLRMLDRDGTPLRRRYECPSEGRLVEPEEVVRGVEVGEGEFVVVSDDEIDATEPEKSREIDLRRFVELDAIPPLLFERSYLLTPAGDSNKAYRLLAAVLEDTGRAGIATFVMRGGEYLVAIRGESGVLRADSLRFGDEVRDPEAVELGDAGSPDERQVAQFEEAIRTLEGEGVPADELSDRWSARLREVAERKREEGRDVVDVEGSAGVGGREGDDEEPEDVDLLETIRSELSRGDGEA